MSLPPHWRDYRWTESSEENSSYEEEYNNMDPLGIFPAPQRLRDRVTIVGRCDSAYAIHFNNKKDQSFTLEHRPWAFNGALLVLEPWRPNIVLENYRIRRILLWIQIRGLPLEYQFPEFADRLGHVIRNVIMVDWKTLPQETYTS
ncbi:hypothetical protein PTKIN_Ptkin05aG0149400 [Pterospermum kingtungense]